MDSWCALCSAGLLLLGVACAPSDHDSKPAQAQALDESAVRSTFRAEEGHLSRGDVDAIGNFIDLPRRWNRASGSLVRDYMDPNISVDRWVRDASPLIAELRAVHVEMTTCTLAIHDPGIRKTFQEITDNYRSKLDCVVALHNAVAQGNEAAEREAQQALATAASEGQRLGTELLERLRPHVDPQLLTRELRERGKEIGDLMK